MTDTAPRIAPTDGVYDTFTFHCVYGCTIHVEAGVEQPHDCAATPVALEALQAAQGSDTPSKVAARVAAALAPLIREGSAALPTPPAEASEKEIADYCDEVADWSPLELAGALRKQYRITRREATDG